MSILIDQSVCQTLQVLQPTKFFIFLFTVYFDPTPIINSLISFLFSYDGSFFIQTNVASNSLELMYIIVLLILKHAQFIIFMFFIRTCKKGGYFQ